MAQYAHKWFNKEEPEGAEARGHEKMEPITGLEDRDDVYNDMSGGNDSEAAQHLYSQRGTAPGAKACAHENMEPITGLEDRHSVYNDTSGGNGSEAAQHLHSKSGTAQTSVSRAPMSAPQMQTSQHGASSQLPVSNAQQPYSHPANGDLGRHRVSPDTDTEGHSNQLATSHSSIMDSHAAMIGGNIPDSAPTDGLNGPHGLLYNHSPADDSTDKPRQRQQQRQQQQQPQLAVLTVDDPGGAGVPMQTCEQQQRAAAQKLEDPGHADGFQQDHSSHPQQEAGSNKQGQRAGWVLFWDGLAVLLAVAITALFIVLMIIDTGSRHAGELGQPGHA